MDDDTLYKDANLRNNTKPKNFASRAQICANLCKFVLNFFRKQVAIQQANSLNQPGQTMSKDTQKNDKKIALAIDAGFGMIKF